MSNRWADDDRAREMAARIEIVFPRWLILWGAYSRRFWAFPRFAAPDGTVVHAADANELAGRIRRVQRAVRGEFW